MRLCVQELFHNRHRTLAVIYLVYPAEHGLRHTMH